MNNKIEYSNNKLMYLLKQTNSSHFIRKYQKINTLLFYLFVNIKYKIFYSPNVNK